MPLGDRQGSLLAQQYEDSVGLAKVQVELPGTSRSGLSPCHRAGWLHCWVQHPWLAPRTGAWLLGHAILLGPSFSLLEKPRLQVHNMDDTRTGQKSQRQNGTPRGTGGHSDQQGWVLGL